MSATITDLHQAKLRRQVGDLQAEMDFFRDRSATPKTELIKHKTQIERITDQLGQFREILDQQIDDLPDADESAFFNGAETVERKLTFAHAIWDHFRRKFLLRYSGHFRNWLVAADEYAWKCFEPLTGLRQEQADYKTPPLIYLGGDRQSPFIRSRQYDFSGLVDQESGLNDDQLEGLARQLPVSVVGFPWRTPGHLPELLVLAHEMGHIVEFDLGLSETLDTAFENAALSDPARRAVWEKKRIEMFADVFGAIVGGQAYYRAFLDFLADSHEAIATQPMKASSIYPTKYLRARLIQEALGVTQGEAVASALREEWAGRFEDPHAAVEFEADVPVIARALLKIEVAENKPMLEVDDLVFGSDQEEDAQTDRKRLLGKPSRLPTHGVREALAAAQFAYSNDPVRYDDENVAKRVAEYMARQAGKGFRDEPTAQRRSRLAAIDKKRGREISGLFDSVDG